MRNAALTLGLIGGLIGIVVGLFAYGATEISELTPEINDAFDVFQNPMFIKFTSFFAPLLAIAGGAMSRNLALVGGIAMLASAALFFTGLGFNIATMFPIGFAGLGGVLAIVSRQPDAPRAH